MPQTVFAFMLAYMCGSHLYRMYVDYMGWSLDFTGMLLYCMLNVTKCNCGVVYCCANAGIQLYYWLL
jgi:hypothetical protein